MSVPSVPRARGAIAGFARRLSDDDDAGRGDKRQRVKVSSQVVAATSVEPKTQPPPKQILMK
eukprot:15181658-Alexandrium_andersonii.AAC.1